MSFEPNQSGAVVCGIQARTGSARLPGKVLADLAGAPLVARVVERVRRARTLAPDDVLVLTSSDPSDDELAAMLEREGIPFRRGPLGDVLQRYLDLVGEREPELVVRVTGDCPLLDPAFLDLQVEALRRHGADLVRVADRPSEIEGVLGGVSAFSARALRAAGESGDPMDREHVGSFFLARHSASFRVVEIDPDPAFRRPDLRLCVDEPADLELARALYEGPAQGRADFDLGEVIAWLDRHPEVGALNRSIRESLANRRRRELERAGPRPAAVGRWPPSPNGRAA